MTIAIALGVLAAMAAVMTAAWLTVRATGDGGWTDVFWTFGTGATCALAALVPAQDAAVWRQAAVAALVAIWALRLGVYIARRVARGPEDVRYRELRKEWGERFGGRMFLLLIVQAPATALLSLSVILAAQTPDPALRIRDGLGALILLAAILGETLADRQMQAFKRDPANEGGVCDTGLWGWSRHPNYLFEALGWFAYPMIALDPSRPVTWLSLVAPAAMFALLRYGNGRAAAGGRHGPLQGRRLSPISAAGRRLPADAAAPARPQGDFRMSVAAAAVTAFEGAPLPDAVRRSAVRFLVAGASRGLRGDPGGDAEFARAMDMRPVAESTDAANAQHYEVPAAFFAAVLGPRLKYSSCRYPKGDETLAQAEEIALAETCEHAALADGQAILELGCGWGSLSLWMAEAYPSARITSVLQLRLAARLHRGPRRRGAA